MLTSALALVALAGCGTTRSSDSMRTATEQLLISDAIDRAVQTIDFNPLCEQSVYLDSSRLQNVVDKDYLISTLRQHLLASGCTLRDKREEADFIVEARAGAVGTDRNDLLFGIPATNVPQILPLQGVPAAIPEVPLAKRLDQRGVAKISMFAYHRESGRPVWQSGLASRESSSNDVWLFGAGPFQYGSVLQQREGAQVVRGGDSSAMKVAESHQPGAKVKLSQQVVFASPEKLVKQTRRLPATTAVAQAAPMPAAAASTQSVATPAAMTPVAARPVDSNPIDSKAKERALVAAAAKEQIVPRLTGSISGADLLKSAPPKTADMLRPASESDSLSLPQPRYDSL